MSHCPPFRPKKLLILALLVGCLTVSFSYRAIAAEPGEYKPPGKMYTMTAHYSWCGEAKTPAERLQRYEKFWDLQAPETSDGYDDMLHVRTVRRCAYRMAQLYAELGKKKECLKMLTWLEKEDDSFKIERG